MNKIEEHLGVRIGERFKLPLGNGYSYYYFNGCYDLLWETTNCPSTEYRFVDLLRNPKMIKKITSPSKEDLFGLKFYAAKGYLWITKDKSGAVWIWKNYPEKLFDMWSGGGGQYIKELNSIFGVNWEDKRPISIFSLIKEGDEQCYQE